MSTLRRVLVTGSSSGLGQSLAASFAADGAEVLGISRRSTPQDGVEAVSLDLADLGAVESAAPTLTRDGLDLVVHCAASYPTRGTNLLHQRSEDLETVFRVNALAPVVLTRALLSTQPEGRACSVVMVGSEAAFHADAVSGAYAASKASARVLAAALAHTYRGTLTAVSCLVLGPLEGTAKRAELERVATSRGVTVEKLTTTFLSRSNPNMTINDFISHAACLRSVQYLHDLGREANGMVCRLDGGSAGSLI